MSPPFKRAKERVAWGRLGRNRTSFCTIALCAVPVGCSGQAPRRGARGAAGPFITAHSSFEASRRSARTDVCRRVTGLSVFI